MQEARRKSDIQRSVRDALSEDVGTGDITAALVPAEQNSRARLISREDATLCGREWAEETFAQIDGEITIDWQVEDGQRITADTVLCTISGPARSILTGERTALNFLQLLSGTASSCHDHAQIVAGTAAKLLDTRKTLPGLRTAQKYAVRCGGCHNHRIGLYDAYLIKENHIAACGSIAAAISSAREKQPGKPVEVEVENHDELQQALDGGADIVMLDNFSLSDLKQAVVLNKNHNGGRTKLEASGNVSAETLRALAETGVDYISIGALTKHLRAIDLSLRFIS